MPLTRYHIKNEYGLGDAEIYRSADKDDPEALIEGVAMAGLVGLLRQLGDLAEFAAEIFHDLHEEVMATASRGHGLIVRIQQLEAEFPPIEKALLLQTNHSLYYSNAGTDWHPNLRIEQNMIARGDLPRFVMDSYEESRGPPHLFLLDKFDVAGAGACLKRYTDPSFLKMDTASSGLSTTELQRGKKARKGKKKGSRWRNGETPECVPPSHAKLHQLFMEERIENAYTDPTRRVKLKRRQLNGSPFDSINGNSLMEKFVETPSPESKTICEISLALPSLEWRSDDTSEQGLGEVEISNYSPVKISPQGNESAASSLYKQGFESEHFLDDVENFESRAHGEEEEIISTAVEEKEVMISGAGNKDGRLNGYLSEEMTGEVDNFMDALPTMESDVETDNNWRRPKQDMHLQTVTKGGTDSDANEEDELELQTEFSALQSVGNSGSDDGDSSYGRSSSSFSNQYEGDRFPNGLFSPKNTVTESLTSSDNQSSFNTEAQERESEELQVSNGGIGIEDKGLHDFVEASRLSCSVELDIAAPLDAEPSLLMGSEPDEASSGKVKHGLGISDSETGANLVDSAAMFAEGTPTQIQDDSVSTNSVECLTVDVSKGTNEEVCSKEMEHPVDFLERPSKTESNDFPVDEIPNMETVAEDSAENLSTVSPQSLSSTEEQDQFSQLGADVDRASTAVCEVSETIVKLESSTLQSDEQQLDKTVTEKNMSDVDVECNGGNSEESFERVDDENIDSFNCNVDVEGVDSSSLCIPSYNSGSDGHANSSDFVLAGDYLDDSAAVGHEQKVLINDPQFLDKIENATLGESLSDVNVHKEERNCEEETILEGERIGRSTCDVEFGGGEATLGIPSNISVSEDPIISDISDEVDDEGIANSDAVPCTEDKVNYLDRADADRGDSLSVKLEESASGVRVLSEERLDDALSPAWRKEQDIIERENELEVAHAFSAPKYSDSISAADLDSVPHDHSDTAEDNSESYLAEKTQSSRDFYDGGGDVVTPPVNPTLGPESKNLLREQPQTETPADQETLVILQARIGSELQDDGGFQDELLEAGEATKLLGHQFEEPESPISSDQEEKCENSSSSSRERVAPPANTDVPDFRLFSEEAGVRSLTDAPPLPPLPPMQWIGKLQNASASSQTNLPGFSSGLLPPLQPCAADEKPSNEFPTSEERAPPPSGDQRLFPIRSHEHDQLQHLSIAMLNDSFQTGPNPFSLPMPFVNRDMHIQSNDPAMEEKQLTTSSLHNTEATVHHSLPLSKEMDPSTSNVEPMAVATISEHCPESSLEKPAQAADVIHPETPSEVKDLQDTAENPEGEKCSDSPVPTDQIHQPTLSEVKDLQHNSEIVEDGRCSDSYTVKPTGQEEQSQCNLPDSDGRQFAAERALQANSEGGKPNGTLISNVPRPPKPLIDAVAAHDRSMMRKVAERVRPQLAPKLEERDSLLEQIRARSFNLKPAVLTRPSVHQCPKTNLRVAAILEKANAIRQALAGSDEDDDADSWSDSD